MREVALRFSLFAFRQNDSAELDWLREKHMPAMTCGKRQRQHNSGDGRIAKGEQRNAAFKKPTRGAVLSGPSMNPSYTVGTRRSSLGISAWRNVAHRTEYESSSLFIEHWFKKR